MAFLTPPWKKRNRCSGDSRKFESPRKESGTNQPTISLAMPAARIYADWGYAARVGGEVVGCEFFTQNTGPYAHFSYLVRNVNTFFKTVSSSQLKSQSDT